MNFDKLKVGIVSLTVGNWDLMNSHMDSLYRTYPHPKEFYIIPNLQFEMSLSAAINKGFKRALRDRCDYIVYCADDVNAGEDSIQTLINTLVEKKVWMVNAQGANSSGWDFFVMDPIIFNKVGFWNETLYPAYFEDNDFARRLTLTDDTKYWYVPVNFEHLGSQTMRRMAPHQQEEHHRNFQRLEALYVHMWGGPPGFETYLEPWNGFPPTEFQGLEIKPIKYWPENIYPTKEDYLTFPGI